jgi:small subunit ribosomal protein S4
MARYTGPKARLMRRFGKNSMLTRSTKYDKILEKRTNPPGQHGARRKKQLGAFGQRMFEKQKLRTMYSISEKQLVRIMAEANRRTGNTGVNLLRLLERRLDTIVFRIGLAPTIWSARQMVSHGHVLVNGKRLDIPSAQLKPGDVVTFAEKIRKSEQVQEWVGRGVASVPGYLEIGPEPMSGRLVREPERDEIPIEINEQLIVEYYAR